ncbi:restriction endonuclease subunit S [Desulfosporosinus sp. OT]|uniref:restriction endonuclease subunit S n=1 Tax=Desulfosporosinus sp. OT TaxID=913865 RepID=UPI000223A183|nr:restriction endonuclease subunit S [Desulfosporosinus sp. OT]EGW38487.1 type I restriction modification DNA specificity domain protein [Desulfosporosinus sp. OT]
MAENTPDIRFGSFAEDWKRSKIGDVITEKKRPVVLDDNTTYQLITVKRRNEGVVSRGFLKGREILVKNYFELKAKDYVISKRQVVHGANGIVPEKLDGAIVSNEYLVAIANDNITTEFLTLISKLPDMYKKFFISSYGIDIEKLVFDVDDWKKRTMSIPDTDEQKRITAFFDDFDKLYSAEQQKHDKLISFKKSMLDKMFPKDGAKVPEVRFDRFSGEWTRKKLDEVADKYDNLRIPITANNRILGSTPYYGANGIQDYVEGYTHDGKFILVAEDGANDLKNYPVQYVEGKIWVNNHAHVLRGKKEKADTQFLKFVISKTKMEPFLVGGGRAKLNAITMMSLFVSLPTDINEQIKIGNFFKNFDAQITLQHQKLQKLTNIKKAFFKKMFL